MDISISIRNSCLLLLLAFCCISNCLNVDDVNQRQLQSAMVVGTVYCDTCFHQQFSKASHFISGASVAVQCGDGTTKTSFSKEVKTNRHGVFRVRLPPKVSRSISNIKACSVKLIRSNEPFCAVVSSANSAGLHLKSKRKGLHVFSAGFFTFKPLKQPELCYQEPKPVGNSKSDSFAERKPAQPAFFFFPPIPFVPSPPIIPFPPIPLVPPPSIVPPILPSPPPSLLPPIFPSPPPSLLPPTPNIPLPFLTSPPPPPASIFPPFPIPFPPNPLFPGNPPAPRSAETSP